MFDKLEAMENRYTLLSEWLCNPDIISDTDKLREYSKEQSDLSETVETYRAYKKAKQELADAKEMLQEKLDDEMREFVKMEIQEKRTARAAATPVAGAAVAEGPERRQERLSGNSRRSRRRRSGLVCGRFAAHVPRVMPSETVGRRKLLTQLH